jgi:hypothetical protein
MDRFAELNTYHHGTLVYFLDKLKTTPDASGSLLDHSLILFGSGMSNSLANTITTHCRCCLPRCVRGRQRRGRHIRVPKDTTHSNLLLTILHKAGVRAEKFGDSTGIVEQL